MTSTLIDDTLRDIRFGVRALGHAPAFTLAALLTLALGIGATSAIFSIVKTVMLEPLPYHQPDRIVSVWETTRGGAQRNVIAPANFVAWRERTQTLDHLGMVAPIAMDMVVNGEPDQIAGFAASADVFQTIGVQPALGRVYGASEDFGGGEGVIVLSHEFWQRRLGGRGDVLGMTLTTGGQRRTVIGVMPAGFTIVGQPADFLVPYSETLEQLRAITGRGNSFAIARLRDGVSFAQASAEMKGIFADLEREFPQRNARRTIIMLPVREQLVGEIRPALFTLIGAVALVLLVACVNVANLLLARSAARERELGMRRALGAGRGRLVRQLLIESLVLSTGGGVAGLALASVSLSSLLRLLADRTPMPRLDQVTLDLPVVAFTMLMALATGVAFGVIPAIVSTSSGIAAIRDSGRHGGGRQLRRALNALVVAEVATALLLLTGAGLLMRSFLKLQQADPGFRADGVLTVSVQLPSTRYTPQQAGRRFEDALSRMAVLPGVQRAAAANCLPMPGPCIGTSVWRADRAKPAAGQLRSADIRPVSPAFFQTLGIPQLAGRDFTASDTADSMPVAIVSEAFAKEQFGKEDPIGRPIRINAQASNGKEDQEWMVVGVVRNIKITLEGAERKTIYLPAPQLRSLAMQFFVRTSSPRDPTSLASSVTAMVRAIEPEAPVQIRTLAEIVDNTIARQRAMSALVVVFALMALALAAVGVYGVMSYSVRERTQEIGVRMALGASSMSVFRLVLGQALRLVAIGIVSGLIAASLLTRLLEGLLYGVEPLDAWTFAATTLLLLIVATIASYLPARRGMKMAPVEALRTN